MDDKQILDLYWARSESAIAETDRKYGKFCHRIAYNILVNHEDSEECVNDTYLKTWSIIPPKRPVRFGAFLGKIVRNLALNRYEKLHTAKRGSGEVPVALDELAECLPSKDSVEAQVDARELGRIISAFVRGLKQRDGDLFLRRYFYMDSLEDAAAYVGLSPKHAAVSLHRTRKKLEEHLRKEGFV